MTWSIETIKEASRAREVHEVRDAFIGAYMTWRAKQAHEVGNPEIIEYHPEYRRSFLAELYTRPEIQALPYEGDLLEEVCLTKLRNCRKQRLLTYDKKARSSIELASFAVGAIIAAAVALVREYGEEANCERVLASPVLRREFLQHCRAAGQPCRGDSDAYEYMMLGGFVQKRKTAALKKAVETALGRREHVG
jgi:hypothetical protein